MDNAPVAKPKRIRKPKSSGGTGQVNFRQGDPSELLARCLNRYSYSSPSETAKADLQEYYKFLQLVPTLLEDLEAIEPIVPEVLSHGLKGAIQILAGLPTIPS